MNYLVHSDFTFSRKGRRLIYCVLVIREIACRLSDLGADQRGKPACEAELTFTEPSQLAAALVVLLPPC